MGFGSGAGWTKAVVGEGAAIYHTAGALDDGRRIWILAKLPDDILVAEEDITEKFLLLSNSHDGSGSVQIQFTPIRVGCHDTLTQALAEEEPSIRVPHTRDINERLKVAQHNLRLIKTTYGRIATDFAALAKVPVSEPALSAYLKLVFPDPSNPKDVRSRNRVERDRSTARLLFTKGKGNQLPGVAGRLWPAYNAIAEMVDQGPNLRTRDQHLEFIWFGGGHTLKVRAFELRRHRPLCRRGRPYNEAFAIDCTQASPATRRVASERAAVRIRVATATPKS